jgi:hypothetical protein
MDEDVEPSGDIGVDWTDDDEYQRRVEDEMQSVHEWLTDIAVNVKSDAEVRNGMEEALEFFSDNDHIMYYKDNPRRFWETVHCFSEFMLQHPEDSGEQRQAWQVMFDMAATEKKHEMS